MQKIISEIFDRVNIGIPNLMETETELAKEIEEVLESVRAQIPQEYYDEIDRRLFEVSGMAEKKGFELGVKYMAKLFLECLS